MSVETLPAKQASPTRSTGQRMLVVTWYVIAAVVSAAIATTVVAVWPAGAANGVPYNDPQSIGAITFYDKAGKEISGGSMADKPFVWRADSSHAAPPPYGKQGRKATLLAYQPREGVSPVDWSGNTLTPSTGYQDVQKPTTQATGSGLSLREFVGLFPAKWDNLIQIRMYFGAPEEPTLTTQYATADIRVTGDTWSVVRAGSAQAGSVAAAAPGAAPGAGASAGVNGAPGQGGGDPAAAVRDSNPAAAVLPAVDTPNVLIVGAAAVVGVVALGLVRRRRGPRSQGVS